MVFGTFTIVTMTRHSKTYTPEEIYSYSSGFSASGNELTAITDDPWIIMENIGYSADLIELEVGTISAEDIFTQVYFADSNGDFSELKSVRTILSSGMNIIKLPHGKNRSIRVDLADKMGSKVELFSLTISKTNWMNSGFWAIFVTLEVVFLAAVIFGFLKTELRAEIVRRILKLLPNENSQSLAVLTGLLLLTSLIVYGKLIFAGEAFIFTDIGSDTQNLYYPSYCHIVNSIRTGDVGGFTFSFGAGTSNLPFAAFIFDPFSWIVILPGVLFGSGTIAHTLIVSQMIKTFVCAYLCCYYLSKFDVSPFARTIASYVYGFNGFLVIWGQHYQLGTFCFFSLLSLIFVEEMLEKKCFSIDVRFTLAIFLMTIGSVYSSYMVMLFAGIYALFRILQNKSKIMFKQAIVNLSSLLVTALFGFGISSAISLPHIWRLSVGSERLNSDLTIAERLLSVIKDGYPPELTFEHALNLVSGNLSGYRDAYAGYSDNYYEKPQLFFSALLITALVYYLFNIHRYAKKHGGRLWRYVAFMLVFALIFTPAPSMVLNGFVAPFGRYTFLLMPVFAVILGMLIQDVLSNKKLSEAPIFIGMAVTILLIAVKAIYDNTTKSTIELMLIALLTVIIFAKLATDSAVDTADDGYHQRQSIRKIFPALCIAMLFLNVTLESSISVGNGCHIALDDKIFTGKNGNDNTAEAVNYIKDVDDGFYRIEKNYYDITKYNDALVQDYNGVSMYSSTISGRMQKFNADYMPEEYAQIPTLVSFIDAPDALVQYSLLGVKYLLSDKGGIRNILNNEFTQRGQFGNISVFENENAKIPFAFYEKAIPYSEFAALRYEDKTEILTKAVILDGDNANLPAYQTTPAIILQQEGTTQIPRPESCSVIKQGDSQLTAKVITEKGGILFIPIPLDQGWTATVDGIETEIAYANTAFMGIPIDAGEHTIILAYSPPLLKIGVGISIACLLLFIFICASCKLCLRRGRGIFFKKSP